MKAHIYLIRPKPLCDPWGGGVDGKTLGVVVWARTETEARNLAAGKCGGEGEQAWLSSEFSTCDILEADSYSGSPVVMTDRVIARL